MKSNRTDQNKSKNTTSKRIRIYELAKQYGLSSKAFIEELRAYGVPVKNHMSTLDTETVPLTQIHVTS